MELLWFWLLIILVIVVVAAVPGWGYTRDRWPYHYGGRLRYYPSAVVGIGASIILLLYWIGVIAIALPWAAAPVAVN